MLKRYLALQWTVSRISEVDIAYTITTSYTFENAEYGNMLTSGAETEFQIEEVSTLDIMKYRELYKVNFFEFLNTFKE